MPEQIGRFDWLRKLAPIALIAVLAVLGVSLAYSISRLIAITGPTGDWLRIMPNVLAILAELAGVLVAVILFGLARAAVGDSHNLINIAGQIGRLETLLEDQAETARKLLDLAALSDEAKSLLYRERELEAMREMMHGMLLRQDYQAAEELIASLEKKPALAQDAAVMRKELQTTRQAGVNEQIDMAVTRVEAIIARGDWARALREAHRMRVAFPKSEKVLALPKRIESAKMKHKRDLLQAYGEAVGKNDVDGSIELLKELDRYLSPQEAAALQDSARGIFKARLHNLGVQFAIRVTEGQWSEAVDVGENIISEFPNSRMAHEVRAKMDLLHQRAAAGSAAPAPDTI